MSISTSHSTKPDWYISLRLSKLRLERSVQASLLAECPGDCASCCESTHTCSSCTHMQRRLRHAR
jgi:hypothetical protein